MDWRMTAEDWPASVIRAFLILKSYHKQVTVRWGASVHLLFLRRLQRKKFSLSASSKVTKDDFLNILLQDRRMMNNGKSVNYRMWRRGFSSHS